MLRGRTAGGGAVPTETLGLATGLGDAELSPVAAAAAAAEALVTPVAGSFCSVTTLKWWGRVLLSTAWCEEVLGVLLFLIGLGGGFCSASPVSGEGWRGVVKDPENVTAEEAKVEISLSTL